MGRRPAEVGPSGALRIYVYPGPGALIPLLFIDYDSLDAESASGRIFYPIGNQVGVPLRIEDQAGGIVWEANHVEPYGTVTVGAGSSLAYALRFPGHYFDKEADFHYNRYSYYKPHFGRYLQCDFGQSGGINLYAYSPNPRTFEQCSPYVLPSVTQVVSTFRGTGPRGISLSTIYKSAYFDSRRQL